MVVVLEHPSIGVDPRVSSVVVGAVVEESCKQGAGRRFCTAALVLVNGKLGLKLSPRWAPVTDAVLREARLVFGEVARAALARAQV